MATDLDVRGWRQIEIAPRDGTPVIGWHPNWDQPVCMTWQREAWTGADGECLAPLLWLPWPRIFPQGSAAGLDGAEAEEREL